MAGTQLSEAELFALVFFELSAALGERASSASLLNATKSLVRLIDNDFEVTIERETARTEYFCYNLVEAFSDQCWKIATYERCGLLFDTDETEFSLVKRRIRYLDDW